MRLRPHYLVGTIAALMLVSPAARAIPLTWAKYVSLDGSFSFHYPEGWKVTEGESAVVVDGLHGDEQLCLYPLPYYQDRSPREHADLMLSALQSQNPGLQASGWQASPEDGTVLFEMAYGAGSQQYKGIGLVVKEVGSKQAIWFHYFAPSTGYSQDRGLSILAGFVASLASGSASRPPSDSGTAGGATGGAAGGAAKSPERLAENADAFMFVLEFALGSPLSLSEERMIRGELERGWSEQSDAELAAYDDYPTVVSLIMTIGDQRQLVEVQQTLARSVLEWIGESDPNDPAVAMIRAHMLKGGKIVVDGNPPLTETAATSYAELMAYAELLQADPAADPSSLARSTMEEIRGQLIQHWLQFSRDEREQIQTAPAIWTTLRKALRYGDSSDRERARSIIVKLAPEKGSGDASGGAMGIDEARADEVRARLAFEIYRSSQLPLNHWMFRQGFHSTAFGY